MVNRKNYIKAKAFQDYLREVAQLKPDSVTRYGAALKHLLVWADEYALTEAQLIRPSFPSYLAKGRLDKHPGVDPVTVKKCVQVAKRFLTWSKLSYPNEFKDLSQLWIDSLRPPRTIQPPPLCIKRSNYLSRNEMHASHSIKLSLEQLTALPYQSP